MSALETSITLDDVFAVATAKRVPLAPELAGYLVLEVADGARDVEGEVDARAVYISEEGTVALVRPKKGMSTGDAETSVRTILNRLLEASGSVTPALLAAAKRRPGGGLPALIQELESALIPVNRAAGRRALARLAREVRRVTMGVGRNALPPANRVPLPPKEPEVAAPAAVERLSPTPSSRPSSPSKPRPSSPPSTRTSQPAPPPSITNSDEVESLIGAFDVSPIGDQQMSRDLKAIAGLDPTPAPPGAASLAEFTKDIGKGLPKPRGAKRQDADAVEALVALADATNVKPHAPPVSGRREKIREEAPRTIATRRDRGARTAAHHPRAPRTSLAIAVLTLLVLAVGIVVVWKIYPSFFAGKKTSLALAPTSALAPLAPATHCTLVVTDAPTNAEILLRVGQSPVDVEHMAMGARLEFVATAEGYLPKRAIVPGESPWKKGPDGKPRIDVPIELHPSMAKPGAVDPWPVAEPGTEVGHAGSPGTVHVVSNVRGAEVWFLAGLGPETRIEHLRCDEDIEVLIAGAPTLRKRLRVNERDVARASTDNFGNKVVTINAK
ncbi:MAG: hypothetical protein FWD69_07265 [Polyangiaceae bacterium]|nr:hypothetical protein [Polyangiaceae bacterium]